ncbi:MAG: choice-of-anchor O protein [Gammaproteobacteria bacterium]
MAEAEHAFIDMMKFYVPSQASNGTILPIDYINADGALVEQHNTARPLIGVYIYGPAEGVEGVGFVGHGKRDAYAAVSLDDGVTWKATNLSESAELTSCDGSSSSSCSVTREDVPLFEDTDFAYPGDVINVFQATDGKNALAVWPSRYCRGGSPNYSLNTSNPEKLYAVADYMGIDIGTDPENPSNPSPDDLYLIDMFGVGGSQGFVDYSDDKFEQNQAVKQVPFSCIWAARGTLIEGDDPRTDATEASYMRWFNAERLSSGRRDVNRIEAKCVAGAGCAISWQEDPEGLRGGQGEGPGEGWSGAVANSQTDVWYSYVSWEHFNLVEDPTDEAGANIITLEEYEELAASEDDITQKPKVAIPFAMPMRVTDNAKCNVTNPQPYCNGSAISADHSDVLNPLDYGMVDMCADTVQIPTGQSGSLADICVTEYGLPLVGNIAATRPRLGLFGYDSDKDDVADSAFVVFEAEESKGLGAFGFGDETGAPCNPDTDENCITFDEGKNVWYYSFNMELTGDNAGNFADKENIDSLLANLGGHGNQLNQPEVDWETGEFYPVANTADFWDFGNYNYEIWNTEIARRGSLLAQPLSKISKNPNVVDAGGIFKPAVDEPIMLAALDDKFKVVRSDIVVALALTDKNGATPAVPAEPNGPGVPATPAIPAIPPEQACDNGSATPAIPADPNGPGVPATPATPAVPPGNCGNGGHGGQGGKAGLVAFPAWKQGIMNQGGPADVMARRIIAPNGWGPRKGNPYAFRNMVCEEWLYGRDSNGTPENPYYPDGLCMDPAINLSGYIPDTCTDSQAGGDVLCPQVDLSQGTTFGVGDTNPVLQGGDVTPNTTKVLSWHQCPAEFTTVSGETLNCENDLRTDDTTLVDQSWYNPLDVSKGHRGYIDGDFIMILYAWSPNWRLNAKGSDRYELYIRRSFDGGETWTTLPGGYRHWTRESFAGTGTVSCETFRSAETGSGGIVEPHVCNAYAAGAAEQARNVTQLKSMNTTTLDPRYTPTAATITWDGVTGVQSDWLNGEDERDPSRYMIVYETGDNTTTAEGEPEPEDLFYSRAVMFGDDYQVWAEETDLSVCYPSDPHGSEVPDELIGSGFCNEFDQLDQGTPGLSASEASLEANPGGEFMYGVWAQWQHDAATGEITESDAMARRVWWLDDYIPSDAWSLPGTP